ncbi:ROK family protein [Planosporangium thailandense]|uniref:ROK family protein n=1 Tax=Planosporangium thailandense TaxID=765197 RepID=A0ABX0XVZ9_9ACTN|nr:ROK family protein [Planosporangium thailandense]NJC69978.1 ROK family protein [Planosporangium thailandense]
MDRKVCDVVTGVTAPPSGGAVTPGTAVIALDVGGTAIKGAVEAANGLIDTRLQVPTPVADGVEAVVAAIVATIEALRAAASPQLTVVGVGIIFPGVVDREAGVARYSANIGWRDLPIRSLVSDLVGLPVAIDHDVRAAGLAEARLGAARGVDEALFVSMGTGVAAAVVTGGAVVSGAGGMAGEFGHLPVMPDGDRCGCGLRGCVEAYASAASLARRYMAAAGAGLLRAEDVITLAGSGDVVARKVFDDAVVALARALVSYVFIMDPSLIVIGGGMAAAGPVLTEPVAIEMKASMLWRDAPPLVTSALDGDAGRRGAALVAWSALDKQA